VLLRVAACCSVLQHVATCCIVLQRVAACCSMLQRVAACCATWVSSGVNGCVGSWVGVTSCGALQRVAEFWNAWDSFRCDMTYSDVMMCRDSFSEYRKASSTRCSALQHAATCCNTLQHSYIAARAIERAAHLCGVRQGGTRRWFP